MTTTNRAVPRRAGRRRRRGALRRRRRPGAAGARRCAVRRGVRRRAAGRHRPVPARAGPGRRPASTARRCGCSLPVALVDRVPARCSTPPTPAQVQLTVAGRICGPSPVPRPLDAVLPYDFPDYRRLLRRPSASGRPRAGSRSTWPALRAALRADSPHGHPRTRRRDPGGDRARRGRPGRAAAARRRRTGRAGPSDAAGRGERWTTCSTPWTRPAAPQLVLELDGPIAPLAVRRPDDADTFSILMPIRL